MGNHNVRSIFNDIEQRSLNSAGDREYRRCKKYAGNLASNITKCRSQRKHSRFTKSCKDEYRRLRTLLGSGSPIVFALMTSDYNNPFQLGYRKSHHIKRCHSDYGALKPCGYNRCCRPCKRVESYPCATYCRVCDKNSL